MQYAEGLCKLLNPVIPFLTEEIWNEVLGHEGSMTYSSWPEYDESKCGEDTFEYAVQVNSRIKTKISIPADMPNDEIEALVKSNAEVAPLVAGTPIKNYIIVPRRLINILL